MASARKSSRRCRWNSRWRPRALLRSRWKARWADPLSLTRIQRPDLTMPEAAARAWAAACADAQTVLEYGSGGSTLVAAEAGADVWSVESDAAWAGRMRDW